LQRLHERDKAAATEQDNGQYMNLETEEVVVAPVHEFAVETASLLPRRLDFDWAGGAQEEEKGGGEEKREGKAEEKEKEAAAAATVDLSKNLSKKDKPKPETSHGRRLSIDEQQWHEQLLMIPCEYCKGKMQLRPGADSPLRQEGEFHAVQLECTACKRPSRQTNGSEDRCRGLRAPEHEKLLAARRGKRRRKGEEVDGRPRPAGNGRVQIKVRAGALKVDQQFVLDERKGTQQP
jgi:hypothetical protein